MKKDDIFFVIPARRDSKGLPFKNRKLLSNSLWANIQNVIQMIHNYCK